MAKEGQRVLSTLRQMILAGDFVAGERVAEIPTSEKLGVSRMPVRIAFRTLEQEGLLVKMGRRGYKVRAVSDADISGAIQVRGVLEGLAALQAAEKGLSDSQRQSLAKCLAEGDDIFAKAHLTEHDVERFHDVNKRFHSTIIEAADNPALQTALERIEHRPFASVSAIAVDLNHLDREYRRFYFAHLQHHAAFDAISNGQPARAEAIMREHANATLNYAKVFGSDLEASESIRLIS